MPQHKDPVLVLVDGSSYLFRAFHALPPLSNSRGEQTGAVYGVINMVRKLLQEYQPDYIGMVFDAPGKTFRDEIYAEYKAHRPPMPDELREQIQPLHEVIRAMGLPLLEIPGVEADDVIGTLAEKAKRAGIRTVISTGDKDLAQLVDENVTLINTMNNTVLDREGVVEKFGVPPERIIDLLALVGDSSDNIPGVPKVGPKTAAKWLNQFGDLENLKAHADEVKGKVGESLRAHLEQLELSRRLATIRRDLDLETEPTDLVAASPDRETLGELFRRLEFKSWLRDLEGAATADDSPAPTSTPEGRDYETILTQKQLDEWLAALGAAELFAFDTETTSLDYMEAELVGFSFAMEGRNAAYLPVGHDYPGAPRQLDRSAVLRQLKALLEDPDRPKVGQNLKYDMNVLARAGVDLKGVAFDTMLESYVLDSASGRHDMDSLALRHLGRETIHYEDVAGKGKKQIPFNQVALEQATPYAAEDADVTLALHRHLWPRLQEQKEPCRVFQEIEMPLVPVLSRMERTGVLIDAEMLRRQSEEISERLREIEAEAQRVAGQPFNLGSTKQLQEILYEKMGLPVLAKTPKGAPSTAESVLQDLALDYELPRLILDYRSLSKLQSTYTDRLPEQINPTTGRVHTSYHQAVAATGRLSSSDPNLQNIPVRTEEGRRIRQAFIAPEGCKLLAADYSQIELRIMAHLSGDEGLLEAFASGQDIHTATAAEVFGLPPDKVTKEQRRAAKAINFGLIYGMSAFGLGRQLGIPLNDAREYVERYFHRYPGVRAYMDETRARAREQGYVTTEFGRRLYVADIRSRNAARRGAAERIAINAPMQGTAADIIKRAMIAIDAWLEERDRGARMIMQVHDELVFEVREDALGDLRSKVRELMCGAARLTVPLVVDIGVGDNWDEAH
ncbi:MAG: DNA polymerase I [Gammaproteobacteria bacterium]